MTTQEACDVLHEMIGRLKLKLLPIDAISFELKGAFPSAQRVILEFEPDKEGCVTAIHFYCLIGYVTDAAAFQALLRGNCAGVLNSPFYCSTIEIENVIGVQLETRQLVSTTLERDQLDEILGKLIANPIFFFLKSGIPGVTLFSELT